MSLSFDVYECNSVSVLLGVGVKEEVGVLSARSIREIHPFGVVDATL